MSAYLGGSLFKAGVCAHLGCNPFKDTEVNSKVIGVLENYYVIMSAL